MIVRRCVSVCLRKQHTNVMWENILIQIKRLHVIIWFDFKFFKLSKKEILSIFNHRLERDDVLDGYRGLRCVAHPSFSSFLCDQSDFFDHFCLLGINKFIWFFYYCLHFINLDVYIQHFAMIWMLFSCQIALFLLHLMNYSRNFLKYGKIHHFCFNFLTEKFQIIKVR